MTLVTVPEELGRKETKPVITSVRTGPTSEDEGHDTSLPSPWPGRLRWLGTALIGAGLALIPWLFVLAIGLPSTATASHWPTAWVGLDGLEALGLITTGVLVNRRDPRSCLTAAVTATLLLVDAWLDVSTAAAGADQATAVAMAICLEIPLVILCAALAVRALPRPES